MSDDYKALFRYDSVRQDKHVREHVVYELTPASPGTSSAATQTVVEERSTKTPDNQVLAQGRAILLLGGLGAVLLVALVAVIVLRSRCSRGTDD